MQSESVRHPETLPKAEKRMIKAQKSLSRKQKGSNNRRKARRKLGLVHLKLSNCRVDFLHKVSRMWLGD